MRIFDAILAIIKLKARPITISDQKGNLMKNRILSIVLVVVLLAATVLTVSAQDLEPITLTIIGTNDIHANYAETPDRVDEGQVATTGKIGYAKISAYKKALEENGPVLLLDGGDTTHGQVFATLMQGESIIMLMNEAGYDAMVPGNHDFNYGYEQLRELEYMAEFPILAANVVFADTGMSLLPEYSILAIDGIKVGVFGIATPETLYKSSPINTKGLEFLDPAETAAKMAEFLDPHVDVVVCLTHMGIDEGSEFVSTDIAEATDKIDVIIDGHSHTKLEKPIMIGDTMIVQAGEHGRFLDQVEIELQPASERTGRMEILNKSARLVSFEDLLDLEPDPEIVETIAAIDKLIDEVASVVVGESAIDLDGERETNRASETNLGDLTTDAMLEATGADVAITNGGGIRASIPAGDITVGQIITTFPFGNYVVTLETTGQDLLDAMEHGLRVYPEPNGGFPQIAGMTVKFDPAREPGSRVVELLVNGEPVDPEKTYIMATNNFLAVGGDQYEMFTDNKIAGEFNALDEILADYLSAHEISEIPVGERIIVIE